MQRTTKQADVEEVQVLQDRLANIQTVMSTITSRANLASKLGYQYGGDRDIYQALGYKKDLTLQDYLAQFLRQDIAKAVVNKPISFTWSGRLSLMESDDDETTDLEKDWKSLDRRFGLSAVFSRLDRLTSLGHYGALLMGFNDTPSKEDFRKAVAPGRDAIELLYLKPLLETSATVHSWETDSRNARYGQPVLYQVKLTSPDGTQGHSMLVHHSRIIHVAGEELLENDMKARPKLEAVFNRLKDLEKLTGGSAEMFWPGARPGYQGKVDSDYQMSAPAQKELKEQIDEYENNLRRILVNEGVSLESLAQQVTDPGQHVDVQVQMISAVTGIPKRLLTGSELGELASSQDKGNWLDAIASRRTEYAEPRIVRPFADRCIEFGVIAAPAKSEEDEDYKVVWPDLYERTEGQKVDAGKARSEALRNYGAIAANQDIIPVPSFLRLFLNLDDDEIELIEQERMAAIEEEEDDFAPDDNDPEFGDDPQGNPPEQQGQDAPPFQRTR